MWRRFGTWSIRIRSWTGAPRERRSSRFGTWSIRISCWTDIAAVLAASLFSALCFAFSPGLLDGRRRAILHVQPHVDCSNHPLPPISLHMQTPCRALRICRRRLGTAYLRFCRQDLPACGLFPVLKRFFRRIRRRASLEPSNRSRDNRTSKTGDTNVE